MNNVDLRPLLKFQTQFSPKVGDVNGDKVVNKKDFAVACCEACKIMIRNAGLKPVSAAKRIDMAKYDVKFNLVKSASFDTAKKQIDDNFDVGKPTLIGVTREKELNSKNGNTSTGHFVLIVARIGNEYIFWDPGTSHEELGTHDQNRLILDANGFYKGTSQYTPNTPYYITETRPTL